MESWEERIVPVSGELFKRKTQFTKIEPWPLVEDKLASSSYKFFQHIFLAKRSDDEEQEPSTCWMKATFWVSWDRCEDLSSVFSLVLNIKVLQG